MTESLWHRQLSQARLHDSYNFVQPDNPEGTDPDILVAGMNWLDTTSEPYLPKRRNDTNDGWISIGVSSASPTGEAGGDLSGTYPNPGVAKIAGVTVTVDTDGTLGANSDAKLATQKAVKTYADQLIAAADAMVFKGSTDCSSNPNYPAADRGHTYRVSVAGKIGGAGGVNVEAGDLFICLTDGTSSGTQAGVGTNWTISQTNLDGAVIGPASATDNAVTRYDATTGKLIQNSLATVDDSGGVNIPSGQTYNVNGSPHSHTSPVDNTAYDATTWDGDTTHAPSKNAVRDKIESLGSGGNVATDTIFDAKGDLPVGTGADTAAKLSVGTNGQILTAASGETTGMKWADAAGAQVLDVNTTPVGNVGAGEDDLITYTVPANTLDTNNQYIHFKMAGIFASSINNKRIRVKLGSTTLFDTGALAITTAGDWSIEGDIVRTGSATQRCRIEFTSSQTALSGDAQYTDATEDLTTNLVLKATGEATSNNDVVEKFAVVEKGGGAFAVSSGGSPNWLGLLTFVAPSSSGWTWDNQGSSTIDSAAGYEYFYAPAQSGTKLSVRYQTPANTHYQIDVGLLLMYFPRGDDGDCGLFFGFRDSGGKLSGMMNFWSASGGGHVETVYNWNSTTSIVSPPVVYVNNATITNVSAKPIFLRISYDGTDIKFYKSLDAYHYELLYSTALTTFLASGTPDIVWGAYANSGDCAIAMPHYKETALP